MFSGLTVTLTLGTIVFSSESLERLKPIAAETTVLRVCPYLN